MFVRDVFRGLPAWVFDPSRRPGTPVFERRLLVSHATGSAVRDEQFASPVPAARRLYRVGEPVDPWIHPAELAAYLEPMFGAPPPFSDHEENAPGGGQPVGYGEAMVVLAEWRRRVSMLPPGPTLLATLEQRPTALSAVPARRAPHLVHGRSPSVPATSDT